MSIFRQVYDSTVVPVLMTAFADQSVPATYEVGSTTCDLYLIKRGERVELETDVHGDEIKKWRSQIVISTDPDSPWGGVESPQLTATFTIDGVRWSVAPSAGMAIESKTESFAVINLVRSAGVSKSYPNSRRE